MKRLMTAEDEVERVAQSSADELRVLADRLVRAKATGNGPLYERTMADVAELYGDLLAWSDLLGRRRMFMLAERAEVAAETRAALCAMEAAQLWSLKGLLPRVEFKEAVASILNRFPAIAAGWRAVAELYRERRGFAAARSMDVAVTKRVQEEIARGVRDGSPTEAKRVIEAVSGWSKSYVDTVYDTNVRTAYTSGMREAMKSEGVSRVLLGFQFHSAHLVTSRPWHEAADGLIAPTDASVWRMFSPPLGYNCKCALREISIFEARSRNLLDANGQLLTVTPPNFGQAHPDEGFGSRG